jgi:DNA-binding response OmpR family regulator
MSERVDGIPALGVTLDHGRHRVCRGAGSFVDLGGQCRLWQVLTVLCRRYDSYLSKGDLRRQVWDDYPAEDLTLWGAVCELRSRLRPLGLTIRHAKGLGYRLEDVQGP